MECNKEEALRAREIAEKKMENKDYVAAHKLILKAKQLFPDLENASQILTVCSVHCSAETRFQGLEMDWYGILQVEQTADEATIKKQYKKLAFLLHPDKNKFAGAESAFKLVGEAMRILCDQAKRALYDMKRRHAVTSTRPSLPRRSSQPNRNSPRRQPGFPNDFMNHAASQYVGMNRPQQQPAPSTAAATFWTMCPFCSIRYQYYRTIVSRALKCQNCRKPFIAHDINAPGTGFGTGTGLNQSSYFQQNDNTNHGVGFGPYRASQPGIFGNTSGGMGFQGNAPGVSMPSNNSNEVRGAEIRSNSDAEKVDELKKTSDMEKQPVGSKAGRKRRKVVESESSDSESVDAEVTEEINMEEQSHAEEHAATSTRCPRRSSRNKKHVCYNENESEDDDNVNAPRSKKSKRSGTSEEKSKSETDSAEYGKSGDEDSKGNPREVQDSKPTVDISEEESKMTSKKLETNTMKRSSYESGERRKQEDPDEHDEDSEASSVPETFLCPDPEFHDFDADKTGNHFVADQVWAVYDNLHGLPRFYALVRKVLSTDFKVRITWLEPSPAREVEQAWLDAELPVACGSFSLGKTVVSEDRLMFSHLMTCERGRGKEYCKVYPKKGEIWALYKHWDINWGADPENHKQLEYEMVEILMDYSDDMGGDVVPLVKVKGFQSLFKRMRNKGSEVKFYIPGGQAYRFSHLVPAYRMKGDERENVPKGSFELDTAALPSNFEASVPFESLDECEIGETVPENHKGDSSPSSSASENGESVSGLRKPKASTPVKGMKCEAKGKQAQINEDVEQGHGVSGDVNGLMHKKPKQVNASKQPVDEKAKTNSNGVSKPSEYSPRVYVRNSVNTSKSGVNVSPVSDSKQPKVTSPSGVKNQSPIDLTRVKGKTSPSSPLSAESPGRANSKKHLVNNPGIKHASGGSRDLPDTEFHKFENDRSIDKFRGNQIWAVYEKVGSVPRLYARIKKVDFFANKIYFTWLEICRESMSGGETSWLDKGLLIPCGVFSAKSSDSFGPQRFSHQVRDDPSWKKGKYGIYPRQGEVWAVYVDWSSGWTKSNYDRCKCSIVEVVAGYDAEKGVTVSHLVRVHRHQTVFRKCRKSEVKQVLEFSHQIPAFQLTNEVGGRLNGCWELDPASVPPELFV